MKAILILAALAGFTRGDVGLGYNYKIPHKAFGASNQYASGYSGLAGNTAFGLTSQGLPSVDSNGYGFRGSNVAYQQPGYTGYQGQQAISSGYHSAGNVAYQSAVPQYQSVGSNSGFHTGTVNIPQPNYQYTSSLAQGSSQGVGQYETSNQYQTANKYQEQYRQTQYQPAQVFKHFYVHEAPEEPQVPRFRQPPVLPAPQKHYKIIFIKTPSQSAPPPQYIPIQPQNEEKTIVYVLVKKPEEAGEIILPKVESKPPAKPEVYFIKYSGKESSQGVINNIVADHNKNNYEASSYVGGVSEGSEGQSGVQSSFDSAYAQIQNSAVDGSSDVSHAASHTSDQGSVAHSIVTGTGGVGQAFSAVSSLDSGAVAGFENNVSEIGIRSGDNGAQSSFSSSEIKNLEQFNTITSNQGLPHETYGTPHFQKS